MMSVNMKKYYAIAEEYDKKLKATDPRFRNWVAVQSLNDGAHFTYPDAFAAKHDDWYFVFTEHYGFHLFHEEDARVVELEPKNMISHFVL